jgi:hypothetical protein
LADWLANSDDDIDMVQSFSELDAVRFFEMKKTHIEQDIRQKEKKFILSVDPEQYIESIINTYRYTPLEMPAATDRLITEEPKPRERIRRTSMTGADKQVPVYHVRITYQFKGTSFLFKLKPMTNYYTEGVTLELNKKLSTVAYTLKIAGADAQLLERQNKKTYQKAFQILPEVNKLVEAWNEQLPHYVRQVFNEVKSEFEDENVFFKAINVQINPETEPLFATAPISKEIVPEPIIEATSIESSYYLKMDMYNDVLKVLYLAGKGIEKKSRLYHDKDEDGLRDMFVLFLETRYKGVTASGETFNLNGKTDIILIDADTNTNLFVAECKIWKGANHFLKAISQLFARYLTTRDWKVALLVFVDRESFTEILEKMQMTIRTHEYYIRDNGRRAESSFGYIFSLRGDKNKEVYVEVLLFNFPGLKKGEVG